MGGSAGQWHGARHRLGAPLAAAVLFAGWEVAARMGWVSELLAPAPSRVAATLWELAARGDLGKHLGVTLWAAGWGLALGVLGGSAAGLAAALLPGLASVLEPAMLVLNAVPRVILAPLFVIWFGIGVGSKVALAFVLVAVLFFFAVYSGVQEVPRPAIERIRTLGGGTPVLLREVYLPSVAGQMLAQLKVAVGFAFTGAVVGEFVASSRGLGYLLSFAQSTYNARLTLAIITLVVAFVAAFFFLLRRLEVRLLAWRAPHG